MSRRAAAVAVLLACVAAAVGQEEPPDPAPAVTHVVTVVSGEAPTPVAGARVEAWTEDAWGLSREPITLPTRADGTVRFRGLPPKGVVFVARRPGFRCAWHEPGGYAGWAGPSENEEPEDGIRRMTLQLVPGTRIEGRVLTKEGLPVVGATVEAFESPNGVTEQWYLSDAPLWTARTGKAGRFRVEEHWAKDEGGLVVAHVTARAPDHIRETVTVSRKEQPRPLTFRLAPAGTIRGRVTDVDGAPVAFASVHACPPDHWAFGAAGLTPRDTAETHPREMHVRTDADGIYALPETPPGVPYFVFAERIPPPGEDDYFDVDDLEGDAVARSSVARGVAVEALGAETKQDLVLRALGKLTLQVAPDAGGDANDLHFEIHPPADAKPWISDYEEDVVVTVEQADRGLWTVEVDATGWLAQTLAVELGAGESKTVTFRLERGAWVEGVVVDDAGEPVAGAKLYAYTLDPAVPGAHLDSYESGESAEDGRYRIDGLPPGATEVFAYLDGLLGDGGFRVDAPASDVRIVLHEPASVRFRLKTPPDGPDPTRVRIFLTRIDGRNRGAQSQETVERQRGAFTTEGHLPGPVAFAVVADGYAPFVTRVTLEAGATVEPEPFPLSVGISLHGRIVDGAGTPVVGAQVMAWGNAENAVLSADDGRFEVPHLAAGTVDLSVTAKGMAEVLLAPRVRNGDDPIEIVLRPGGLVRGTIRDRDRDYGTRASIDFFRADAPGENVSRWRAETSRKGAFSIRLPAGRYRCPASRADGPAGAFEFEVTEGGEIELTLLVP